MRKIILRGSAKTVGTDFAEALLVSNDTSDDKITEYCYEASVENAQMYGWDLVDDYSNEYDNEVTSDDLEYWWEEYDSEEHEGLRAGGGSFEEDFSLQSEQYK